MAYSCPFLAIADHKQVHLRTLITVPTVFFFSLEYPVISGNFKENIYGNCWLFMAIADHIHGQFADTNILNMYRSFFIIGVR